MRNGQKRPIIRKNQFEVAAWSQNCVVAGIDEVGRGCLAGPVVAGATILPVNPPEPAVSDYLKDSKLLSPKERDEAYAWILKNCWWAIGIAHHRSVDQHNIYHATLIAMKKAFLGVLAGCPHRPSAILVDAMPLSLPDTAYSGIPVHFFPKGEQKSSSIAAASIVAKVIRDRMMDHFDPLFPGYQLAQHKGYATKSHQEAVFLHGRSLIHRTTFSCKTPKTTEKSTSPSPLQLQII